MSDPAAARTCCGRKTRFPKLCWRIILWLPSRPPSACGRSRSATPRFGAAVDAYADAIVAVSGTENQIADLDREVLGAEGRQIGRVTDLLRDVSARRGRELATDFGRTLRDDKWQSILLGIAGVLSGVAAALFVVGRTVRPLKAIAKAIRALAGGEKHTSIPATDVENEIGDIARAAEVFRRSLVDADTAREAAIHALAEQRLAEESYRKLFEGSVDGIYVTTPGRRAAQRQSGVGADNGI